MTKPIYIQITSPCHQDWSEMTRSEQGAFCDTCQKNVIDFTSKTENEIRDIITQTGGELCGRLTQFQLNRPLRKTEIKNGYFNWRAIAASLAALITFNKPAKAFSGDSTQVIIYNQTNGCHVQADTIPVLQNTIAGRVVDAETYEPLPGANVYFKNAKTGVVANWDGIFIIENAALYLNDTLIIKYLANEEQSIPVSQFKSGSAIQLQASLLDVSMIGSISYSDNNPLQEIGGYNDLTPLLYREPKTKRKKIRRLQGLLF